MVLAVSFRLPHWGISLVAGLAAAFAFLAGASGILGFLLANFAPLPLMIASLGWGASSGAMASAFAVALIISLTSFKLSLEFAALVAIPSVILSVLAQWRRTPSSSFYPFSRLLAWITWVSTFVSMVDIAIWSSQNGGYEAASAEIAKRFQPLLQEMFANGPQLPPSVGFDDIASVFAHAIPFVSTALQVMFFSGCLWIAARVAQAPGQLARPFPEISAETALPRDVLVILALAVGLLGGGMLVGSTSLALASGMIIIGIVAAYALQGLAVIHFTSRRVPLRGVLLTLIYFGILFLSLWPLAIAAGIGFVDAFHPLRRGFPAAEDLKL